MIDYQKLNLELMRAVANNSIKLADSPELKKLINEYLKRFDNRINTAVNNLKYTANKKQDDIQDISKQKYDDINKIAKDEKNKLVTQIDATLTREDVNIFVKSTIQNIVSSKVNESKESLQRYFSSLDKNQEKVSQLSQQVDSLSKKLHHSIQNFCLWTAVTIIITAIIVYIAL